jgi:hypothetical protein
MMASPAKLGAPVAPGEEVVLGLDGKPANKRYQNMFEEEIGQSCTHTHIHIHIYIHTKHTHTHTHKTHTH